MNSNSTPQRSLEVMGMWQQKLIVLVHLLLVLVLLSALPSVDAFSLAPPSPSNGRCSIAQDTTTTTTTTTTRIFGKSIKVTEDPWFPLPHSVSTLPSSSSLPNWVDDELYYQEERSGIEFQAINLAQRIIESKLQERKDEKASDPILVQQHDDNTTLTTTTSMSPRIQALVQNRFMDLACHERGEAVLEQLFAHPEVEDEPNDNVIRATVMAMQSLCIFATQVGVKGTPEQLQKMVAHLDPRRDPTLIQRDLLECWDGDSVRRLKYQLDRTAAVQLLAALRWKRTTQGAFHLLVNLGAWEPHEDVALLRSGFPLRFPPSALEAANVAQEDMEEATTDCDELLGLRKDLRRLKVYTIDAETTMEVDDGLSVETVTHVNPDTGLEEARHKIWIHIADADRLAPPGSILFDTARKRITSLYLPNSSISMFPHSISSEIMSLRPCKDVHALSLGLELNPDGSIDESTIEITPSLIHVTYRLSYDDVDEMLEEGIGYAEEWELGALLTTAHQRRQHRIDNGSTEGVVPNPIPYTYVTTFEDESAPDGIGISLKLEVSHNAGRNQTYENGLSSASDNRVFENTIPASSSFLLVTECMIMAGEALGRWKRRIDSTQMAASAINGEALKSNEKEIPNTLRLPFRTQPKPDYRSRAREKRMMNDLLELNVGDGLCYSWFIRRFLQPVKISEIPFPHSGLGLECYVQWTSPIRRYSDLQVHAAVKRFLRRKRCNELVGSGEPIPEGVQPSHLGIPSEFWSADCRPMAEDGRLLDKDDLDQDINYFEGVGLIGAARFLQRKSQQYWLFEYMRRQWANHDSSDDKVYQAVVLGCTDPDRQQYAIYVYELGLEHRYVSIGQLDPGTRLRLKVQRVNPRNGLLTFVRVV